MGYCFSEGRVIGWIRTLSTGEAVALLQSLHAIDLLQRTKCISGDPGGRWRAPRAKRRGTHSRPPGRFHSQSRSSEDLLLTWISDCGARVKAEKQDG